MDFFFLGLGLMIVLLFMGQWMGVALGFAAFIALFSVLGIEKFSHLLATLAWSYSRMFSLSAVPLFVLMGAIACRTGLIERLFKSFEVLTRGRLPGGLIQPVIFATAAFGACSGSSIASAAAFSSTVYPTLKAFKYPDFLSTGAIAAGGTLSILIPPSIIFLIYGTVADVSVGALFIGGIIPGIVMAFLFSIYVAIRALLNPRLIPKGDPSIAEHPKIKRKEIIEATINLGLTSIIMFSILVPLYLGVATPTEVASIGVLTVLLIGLILKQLNWSSIIEAATDSIKVNGIIFFILFSAVTFSSTLSYLGLAKILVSAVDVIKNPIYLLVIVSLFYILMGMFFDPISMVLVALPFLLPMLKAAGFDLLWLGIYMGIQAELAEITPPVGMNLYVIKSITNVQLAEIIKGAFPFMILLALGIIIIYLFPQLVIWLPSKMLLWVPSRM